MDSIAELGKIYWWTDTTTLLPSYWRPSEGMNLTNLRQKLRQWALLPDESVSARTTSPVEASPIGLVGYDCSHTLKRVRSTRDDGADADRARPRRMDSPRLAPCVQLASSFTLRPRETRRRNEPSDLRADDV